MRRSYAATTLDTRAATFTRRAYESDARQPIPPDAWQFAPLDERGNPVPSASACFLAEGFRPGWIYELIYTARDPRVLGLGLTGLRDLISFLLHAEYDTDGVPKPLRDDRVGMEKAYGWGRSQSGRLLREFVYRGFNEDAHGRQVFAGLFPHVTGGGRGALNYRFAQPGRYPRQYSAAALPVDPRSDISALTSTMPDVMVMVAPWRVLMII